MNKRMFFSVNTIAKVAIFIAVAFIVSIFEISLPLSPPFYKIDFSSAVVLLGSYTIGPLAGIIIAVLKTVLKMITFGSQSAFVGEYVDIIITILYVFPASVIYRNHNNNKNAILGMSVGVFFMTLCGCILNYYLLIPIYAKLTGIAVESIVETTGNALVTNLKSLVIFVTLPFNILKGTVCSVIGYLCLLPITKLKKKHNA